MEENLTNVVEEAVEAVDETNAVVNDGSMKAIIIGTVAAGVLGITAVIVKLRKKLALKVEKRMANTLIKKGYTVAEPLDEI